jgi:hypothetical protein
MDPLDGNAIGGLLIDVFGAEMTAAQSTCVTCGDRRPVAELVVYRQAPGTVVRCRVCGGVLMVFVRAHGVIGTDLTGLASLSQPNRLLSRRAESALTERLEWRPRRGGFDDRGRRAAWFSPQLFSRPSRRTHGLYRPRWSRASLTNPV